MTKGEYLKIEESEYRAHPGLNVSRLCLMDESPRHYHLNLFKESEAMRFGTLIHKAILEPEEFKQHYVVEPSVIDGVKRDLRKKAHREFLQSWKANLPEKAMIMSPDQGEAMAGILNSLREEIKRPSQGFSVADLFKDPECEVSMIRNFMGRECKGRADLIVNSKSHGRVMCDLKKVGRQGDAKASKFRNTVSNYHYDAKAAWYVDLFGVDSFFWLAIEEKAPHAIGFYNAEPFLDIGRKKYKSWLNTLEECEKTKNWPWYTDGAQDLIPSAWVISQYEEGNW